MGGRTIYAQGFNPRPHTAGDAQLISALKQLLRFNPRPHTAGDRAAVRRPIKRSSFNPRPHTAGDSGGRRENRRNFGFNPRPHTAGDPGPDVVPVSVPGVSIHARTRRATNPCWPLSTGRMFQSTPAHGGRRKICQRYRRTPCFNPRPHTAGDLFSW